MTPKPSPSRRAKQPSATQQQSSTIEVTDKDLQARVGDAVRLARVSQRVSQRELAKRIGRSQNYVHQVEAGKTDPGIISLRRIAEVLGTKLDFFIAPVVKREKASSKGEREAFDQAQSLLASLLELSRGVKE